MIDATSMGTTSHKGEDSNEMDQDVIAAQWNTVNDQLRGEIGEAAYQSWIKPIRVRNIDKGIVHATVPTRFMRDWIVAHYAERIATLWQDEVPEVASVDVAVRNDRAKKAARETIKRQTPPPAGTHPSTSPSSAKA